MLNLGEKKIGNSRRRAAVRIINSLAQNYVLTMMTVATWSHTAHWGNYRIFVRKQKTQLYTKLVKELIWIFALELISIKLQNCMKIREKIIDLTQNKRKRNWKFLNFLSFWPRKFKKCWSILMDIFCSKLVKLLIWIFALKLLNRQKAKYMKYLKLGAKIKDFDSKWAKTKVKILEFFGKFWSWF